ncbi:hypothetical protein [Parendozoicomonas haliclonae]|nr:hypothetical protein [Parendozoicomonas haliclonae]
MEQAELNKEAFTAASQQKQAVDREQMNLLNGIDKTTEHVLNRNNWQSGIRDAKEGGKTVAKNVGAAVNALRGSKQTSQPNSNDRDSNAEPSVENKLQNSKSRFHSAGSGDNLELSATLDQLKQRLLALNLPLNQWELYKKKDRLAFDIAFAEQIIQQNPSYSLVISTFADRLAAASQQTTTNDFSELFAEITLLHLYLHPAHGLRLTALGMRKKHPSYRQEYQKRFHLQSDLQIEDQKLKTMELHQENLQQALTPNDEEYRRLTSALNSILEKHAGALSTFSFHQYQLQTAITLSAIVHDLSEAKATRNDAVKLAKRMQPLATLWEFSDCRQHIPNGQNRNRICSDLLEQDLTPDHHQTIAQADKLFLSTEVTHFTVHQLFHAKELIFRLTGHHPLPKNEEQ